MKSSKYGWAGPNQDLVRTLDDYCYGKDVAPFALMLTGAWGSGKTWLVDRFFEEKKKNRSNDAAAWFPLRVSLFGIESAAGIGDALYAELHPVLAGKPGQVGGFVVRSLLKSTLRIELKDLTEQKGKGKTGGGVTLAGADLSGLGRDGKPRRRIIVFDDLERAKMPVTDIMAAIHPLVGTGENRVVLLVNEKEIAGGDKDEEEWYRRTKEKTVGLTLEVKPDFASAFSAVSESVKNAAFQRFLRSVVRLLEPLVIRSGVGNLRLLSFFIELGERLFMAISAEYRTGQHDQALSELFTLVYVAIIETRIHGIEFDLFEKAMEKPRLFLHEVKASGDITSAEDKENALLKRIQQSYDDDVLYSPLISGDDLKALVMRATVNSDSVNKSLALDRRFTDERSLPSWIRVWDYARSSMEELEQAIRAFRTDFATRKFVGLDMLHACSLYLTLHRVGEPGFATPDPVSEAERYIEDVFAQKELDEADIRNRALQNLSLRLHAPFNRSFSEEGTEDFKRVLSFFREQQELWLKRKLVQKGQDLTNLFRESIPRFMALVFGDHSPDALYKNVPVLQFIDAQGFARVILRTLPWDRMLLVGYLDLRFKETVSPVARLHAEFLWFHKLSEALKTAVAEFDGSPLFREGLKITISHLCDSVGDSPLRNTSNV